MLYNKVKRLSYSSSLRALLLRSASVVSDATPQLLRRRWCLIAPRPSLSHCQVRITSRRHHPQLSVGISLLSSQLTEGMFAGPVHVRLSTRESAKSRTLRPVTYSNSLFVNSEKVASCSFWAHLEADSRALTWQRLHEETAVFHFLIKIQRGLVKGNGCAFSCHVSSVKGQLCMPLTNSVSLSPYLSPSTHHPLPLPLFFDSVLSLSHLHD